VALKFDMTIKTYRSHNISLVLYEIFLFMEERAVACSICLILNANTTKRPTANCIYLSLILLLWSSTGKKRDKYLANATGLKSMQNRSD